MSPGVLIFKGKFFCFNFRQSLERLDLQGFAGIGPALSPKLSTGIWGN
jgi:hypothetical protein